MVNESEFKLLKLLQKSKVINRDNFKSDEEFDYFCEVARSMLDRDLIHTANTKPFLMNHRGKGSKYQVAGGFNLSAEAIDILTNFPEYAAIENLATKESQWNLSNRLTVIAIVIALIGLAVTLVE
ncbi:MAG: hypothetical protein OQK09_13750 [Colwellia sp.]|nr:hypothetical protein [Colwellia sp.]MCW8864231.1 hypothetical protein [Colwellia sp.]MCW9082571.1 hypothetical protein [Colwellia sp.]